MSQVRSVTYVSGLDKFEHGERGGTRTLDPMIKSHVPAVFHGSARLTLNPIKPPHNFAF
jgi:hypothetical protein